MTERRKLVLVVDDHVDSARGLAMLLELAGCEVEIAHDGAEAMDASARHHPDAILLDIGLPDRSGYDVARELRSDAKLDGAMLIAVSGYGHDEARQASSEAGFDHHIVKPADPDLLLELIERGRTRSAGPAAKGGGPSGQR